MKQVLRFICFASFVIAVAAAHAGYEQPAYIDGCQSVDGRYVITAVQSLRGKTVHGPHKWEFIWRDTKSGETKRFPAQGIQGGQIYAQLFIAPDGETFALWNHITQYWPEKSHMHSHDLLPGREEVGEDKYRALDIHKKRLIIFRKDGSVIMEFGVGDFLADDTPAWLPKSGNAPAMLLFTDLEQEKLYRLTPPDAIDEIRSGASHGKAAADKRFYGMFDGKLASWRPGEEPLVILEKAVGGREILLNDIAITSRGCIYFTTLKDPEKGGLTMVDPATREATLLFDGEDRPTLCNPNGIAVDPDERFLFVGISSYANRKHSGVYCFPIRADGTIDVETGKTKPWADVKAPDGIAVHRNRDVYFTAGGKVEVFDPYGRRRGHIKIPKGSGTNLCFGGDGDGTLYITTWNALYAVEIGK